MSTSVGSHVTDVLAGFAAWLGKTPLFDFVAGVAWVVPALQTVHILAVAVVIASAAIIDLRVLGLVERDQPLSTVFQRFLPPLAGAVGLLALTGVLLIAGEPTRAIFRVVFWIKLALVATAAALTWGLAAGVRRWPGALGGDRSVSTPLKVAAASTLLLWIVVIVAGRWIGYAVAWAGAPQ